MNSVTSVGEIAGTESLQEHRSLPSLEGLRLIASCSIVASHYLRYFHLPTEGLNVAVDLFFVISGIVIAMVYAKRIQSPESYASFVRKRIARLYPLHVATLLFYVVIGAIVTAGLATPENAEKYNPNTIIPNLLMIHAWSPYGVISYNYVSWSISAEFFVYLSFPLILVAMTRGFAFGLVLWAVLLTVAIFLSEKVVGAPLTSLNWEFGEVRAVPAFSFGVWLWIYRDRLSTIHPLRSWAGPILGISLVVALTLMVFNPAPYLLLSCMYVIASSALLCDLTDRRTFASWKPLSSRGYLTYSIYMLHTVVATIVISFAFPRLLGRSPAEVLIAVATSVALTYVAAYFSYWYFELPLRKLIGGRRPPKTSAAPSHPRP